MKNARKLSDLSSVGPATLKDFAVIGIKSVEQLAKSNPKKLYDDLCKRTGQQHDICALDVFTATVAQAKNPNLPAEKRNWWYWSRVRKQQHQTEKKS